MYSLLASVYTELLVLCVHVCVRERSSIYTCHCYCCPQNLPAQVHVYRIIMHVYIYIGVVFHNYYNYIIVQIL